MTLPRAEDFLVVHGVTEEEWAEKYDLIPLETNCRTCMKKRRTTIPIALRKFRGLKAPPCECGDASHVYCIGAASNIDLFGLLGKREEEVSYDER